MPLSLSGPIPRLSKLPNFSRWQKVLHFHLLSSGEFAPSGRNNPQENIFFINLGSAWLHIEKPVLLCCVPRCVHSFSNNCCYMWYLTCLLLMCMCVHTCPYVWWRNLLCHHPVILKKKYPGVFILDFDSRLEVFYLCWGQMVMDSIYKKKHFKLILLCELLTLSWWWDFELAVNYFSISRA